MRKRQWMWMLPGLLALVLAACGTDDEIKTCALDADCGSAELCHPNVKVCVKTCTSSGDCPDSAKTCDAISKTDDRKICRCVTTALCNNDRKEKDLVCNDAYKVCIPEDKNKDVEPPLPPDEVGAPCDSNKPQPDVCKHGLVCGSDNKCAEPPSSSACSSRFEGKLNWDPSKPTGPIIYSVESLGGGNRPNHCQGGGNMQFRVKAYSTGSQLQKFNNVPLMLYRPSGSPMEVFIGGAPGKTGDPSVYSTDGWVNNGDDQVTILINLCPPSNNYVAGLAFNNGNTACVVR